MIKKVYTLVKNYHFALLPVFFMFHIINYYYGLVPADIIRKHSFAYLALTLSIYLFSKAIFKTDEKTGIFTFITLSFFFGFGYVKDFLSDITIINPFIQYKIILPAILIMLGTILFFLKRSNKSFSRLATFFFLAISINLIFELIVFTKKTVLHAEVNNDFGDPMLSKTKDFTPCTSCDQPDVYFIIFDEFTSSASLKKYWNYPNDTLNNFLKNYHFFVSEKSKSNYSFTCFSLAATFEMQYLNLPEGYKAGAAIDLARGEYTLFKNSAVDLFEKQGYTIHNYSIFDMANYPAFNGLYFNNLSDLFISDETLFGRTMRDIGWNLHNPFERNVHIRDSLDRLNTFNLRNNYINKTITDAENAIENDDNATKDFYYFHFLLPHDPYIYDENGKFNQSTTMSVNEKYLEQVKYATKVLMRLTKRLFEKTQGKAVIILQGDHGFKSWPGEDNFKDKAFENLNAIYLPDTNYTGYYNGVSPVNTYRLLFNHYFNTHYKILPDTSVPFFFQEDLKRIYGLRQKNS